eukprot:gene4975-8569_t
MESFEVIKYLGSRKDELEVQAILQKLGNTSLLEGWNPLDIKKFRGLNSLIVPLVHKKLDTEENLTILFGPYRKSIESNLTQQKLYAQFSQPGSPASLMNQHFMKIGTEPQKPLVKRCSFCSKSSPKFKCSGPSPLVWTFLNVSLSVECGTKSYDCNGKIRSNDTAWCAINNLYDIGMKLGLKVEQRNELLVSKEKQKFSKYNLDRSIKFENDNFIFDIYFTRLFREYGEGNQNGNVINGMFLFNKTDGKNEWIKIDHKFEPHTKDNHLMDQYEKFIKELFDG